ncbi:unnamed protein product [Lactuca virosa]|uniref:Uncharacterized protein n=1 Tax=Lactuca virosa TaxID=75947 RepID=A0AAU9MK16_9ASTR|nr:unnamed protein product [Lactuca virosa]
MDQPSNAPLSSPVSVIGSRFMAPYQFDIIVDIITRGNLVVTDIDHKIMLQVKTCDTSFHQQRVLVDADGKPIVLMRGKIMSEHDRWNVFRGNSKSKSDMIFTTQSPHMIQFKTSVQVFLANKTNKKNVCDFKINGSWTNRNCTINMGDTSTPIAQMSKMQSSEDVTNKFMVTIYPNVDYAFVVILIAIVEVMKMNNSDIKDKFAQEVIRGLGDVVVGALLL